MSTIFENMRKFLLTFAPLRGGIGVSWCIRGVLRLLAYFFPRWIILGGRERNGEIPPPLRGRYQCWTIPVGQSYHIVRCYRLHLSPIRALLFNAEKTTYPSFRFIIKLDGGLGLASEVSPEARQYSRFPVMINDTWIYLGHVQPDSERIPLRGDSWNYENHYWTAE